MNLKFSKTKKPNYLDWKITSYLNDESIVNFLIKENDYWNINEFISNDEEIQFIGLKYENKNNQKKYLFTKGHNLVGINFNFKKWYSLYGMDKKILIKN